MIGSLAIAGFIASAAFVVLIVWGWASGELGPRAITVFVMLGALAWVGLPRVSNGANFVTLAPALIDVALVFAVFKGDVRIG